MAPMNDMSLFEENWAQFNSPMFSMVNPNDVCPSNQVTTKCRVVNNVESEVLQHQYNTYNDLHILDGQHIIPIIQGTLEETPMNQRSENRNNRIKTRPEKPPVSPLKPVRSSGRKLSSRERQLELERQEAQQLKLRSQYLELISILERKCSKLREILENIVVNSPEYNSQMLNFLETSELLVPSTSKDDRISSIMNP